MVKPLFYLIYLHSCAVALSFGTGGRREPLRLDFSVHHQEVPASSSLQKRLNGTLNVHLKLIESLFLVNITVGSPGQQITVKLDTSEGDLWVTESNATCVTIPDNPYAKGTDFCKKTGVFNSSLSKSVKLNLSMGPFGMVDSNYFATGSYAQDHFQVSGTMIPDMIFGLVNASTIVYGSLGVGPPELELTYSTVTQMSHSYLNFPMRLKAHGFIYKAAYSLYFKLPELAAGSVLFGGVDHKKYSGQLQTVPLIPVPSNVFDDGILFGVMLNSMGIMSPDGEISVSQSPFIIVPNTLAPYSMLPVAVVSSIVKALRGNMGAQDGYLVHIVDCTYLKLDITLTFEFSGKTVEIPLSSWILKRKNKCLLTVSASLDQFILGNDFLAQVYTVFNNDDHELSLATAVHNDDEDIELIISGVPSAVRAANYSMTATPSSFSVNPQKSAMLPSGKTISKSTALRPLRIVFFFPLVFSFLVFF